MEIEFEIPVDNPEELSEEERFQYRYTCRVLVEALVLWFENSGLKSQLFDFYILAFVNTISFRQTWIELVEVFDETKDFESMYNIIENGLLNMRNELRDCKGYLN